MKTIDCFLYDRWMDCSPFSDQLVALPCGHKVHRDNLRAAGGICPVCEQDKDAKEMGNFPPEG